MRYEEAEQHPGAAVRYTSSGGETTEEGVIDHCNPVSRLVFVRYRTAMQATYPEHLTLIERPVDWVTGTGAPMFQGSDVDDDI